MRRGVGIWAVLLVVLLCIGVGVGAYQFGVSQGLEDAGRGADVVRVYRHGFGFPFGLILFPLFLFGIFALFRAAFWGRHWDGPGNWGHGPLKGDFEDWHRRQHEPGSGEGPGPGAGTSSA